MTNFTPCRICAKKKGPFPGFYFVEEGEATYVKECECHKQWFARQNLERRLSAANLWVDLDYDPDRHYRGTKSLEEVSNLKFYVKNFDKRFSSKMVYLYGANGTQKTTLAMWVGRELIREGKTVYYSLMENLSIALAPDFNAEDNSRAKLVERALDADLLILDESFDRTKMTLYKSGYQIPLIDSLIRNRFDIEKKAIIFISNKPASTLVENGFGESLQSLITRNTRESTLSFKDEYIKEANNFDPKGLFK
jgi:DNA replication protein DnaC